MSIYLNPNANEWRLYFCIVGELWSAVRDKQPEPVILDLLEELQGLAFTTSQDLLFKRCQRILNVARSASYTQMGA